jgi:hypothetical protein
MRFALAAEVLWTVLLAIFAKVMMGSIRFAVGADQCACYCAMLFTDLRSSLGSILFIAFYQSACWMSDPL